jgi:hypothetical protein
MAVVSGEEADRRSEGGQRPSNWEGWSHGDHAAINHAVDSDAGTLLGHAGASNSANSSDHLHFYDNPEQTSAHHKPDHEVGARIVEDKGTRYISEDLFDGVKNFFGW